MFNSTLILKTNLMGYRNIRCEYNLVNLKICKDSKHIEFTGIEGTIPYQTPVTLQGSMYICDWAGSYQMSECLTYWDLHFRIVVLIFKFLIGMFYI